MSATFLILRNGRPIVYRIRRATDEVEVLAWSRAGRIVRSLGWWRRRFPRSNITAVVASDLAPYVDRS